jgi:hypothetical protein
VYRAIWRERTFYSRPAIVDDIIRHFPEHRKLALLADEPPPAAFNAFTIAPATYALGLFIASAGFDGARSSRGRVHLHAGQCPADPVALGAPLARARQRLLADRASSSPAALQATALA